MQRFVFFVSLLLCLSFSPSLGCKSILNSSSYKTESPPAPQRTGYLAEGATVKIDTGEKKRRNSVLEQLDQTRKELALAKEKINSLEKQLNKEETKTKSLENRLRESKKQLKFTQKLKRENKELKKQLENAQAPYEEKIKELTMELAKARLAETKAKQELVGLKIELLVEKRGNKSP